MIGRAVHPTIVKTPSHPSAPEEESVSVLPSPQGNDAVFYAAILETSPDAIISIAKAGKITEWNPAAEEMFGYTRALAVGREATELIAPDTGKAQLAEFLQSLKTGKGRLIGKRTEMTAVRANGWEFPIELILTLASEYGKPSFIACIRDITERKQAEAFLVKSEERFRMLVESVEDYAIHLLDPRGRVLTWNAGVERIDGYRACEIIGRRFNRLYTPDDIALGKPEHALVTASAEGSYSHEGWSMRKDGSRYWASVVLTALRRENGALFGYSRIGRDRTKRREAEIEAERTTAALECRLRERTSELKAATRLLERTR